MNLPWQCSSSSKAFCTSLLCTGERERVSGYTSTASRVPWRWSPYNFPSSSSTRGRGVSDYTSSAPPWLTPPPTPHTPPGHHPYTPGERRTQKTSAPTKANILFWKSAILPFPPWCIAYQDTPRLAHVPTYLSGSLSWWFCATDVWRNTCRVSEWVRCHVQEGRERRGGGRGCRKGDSLVSVC